MAGNERFDDSISRWLEETAPDRLPQRVLSATFDRTRRTRQTAWRMVVRRPQFPRSVPALGSAAAVAVAAVLVLNIGLIGGPGGTPTPPPSATGSPPTSSATTSPSATASPSRSPVPSAPTLAADVTELLNRFLDARVAGEGAEKFLEGGALALFEAIPLLYATTDGLPYERWEFVQISGYEWPYGLVAVKVRLFAPNTVVEQLLFAPHDPALYPDPSRAEEARLRLVYVPDGFGTEIAPTTENGRPVARPYSAFDGAVTVHVAHPWVFRYASTSLQLVPDGTYVNPTTDGGERTNWDRPVFLADPARTGSCAIGQGPIDAEALSQSIRSNPDLETTAAVPAGDLAAGGLMVDVAVAAGAAGVCGAPDGPSEFRVIDHVSLAKGERMRLYLFDAPEGSSMRLIAIVLKVPESRFESAVEAMNPIRSVEFHTP